MVSSKRKGRSARLNLALKSVFFLFQYFDIVIASDGISFFILMILPGDQTAVCGK